MGVAVFSLTRATAGTIAIAGWDLLFEDAGTTTTTGFSTTLATSVTDAGFALAATGFSILGFTNLTAGLGETLTVGLFFDLISVFALTGDLDFTTVLDLATVFALATVLAGVLALTGVLTLVGDGGDFFTPPVAALFALAFVEPPRAGCATFFSLVFADLGGLGFRVLVFLEAITQDSCSDPA